MAFGTDNTRTNRFEMEGKQIFAVPCIEKVNDSDEIFKIADKSVVDFSGFKEVDDMETRMIQSLKKSEGEPDYKYVVANSMLSMKTETRKKREKLVKCLRDLKDRLSLVTEETSNEVVSRHEHDECEVIKGLLETEGTIKNLDQDVNNRLESLKRDNCTIVVRGESFSGKTNIVNLLFGEEVVPTACIYVRYSSIIFRIRYYKQRRFKITYKNGKAEIFRNIQPGEIASKLKSLLRDNSEQLDLVTPIREIKVYLPAKILECGIVLVVEEQCGEFEESDEVTCVPKFVNENHVDGFLYVIKSVYAGEVDKERVIELVKAICEREKEETEGQISPFDFQCALFVCNSWDLMPEDQTEKVFNNVYHSLVSIWPNMTKSQLMTFSTVKAKMECDIDPDFIVDNYKQLLDNIRNVYNKTINTRVVSTHKWLETVLKRSVHHLKTIVHRLDSSEKDFETKMRSVLDKLDTLKVKSELAMNDIRKQTQDETDEICEEFGKYLQLPKTQMKITSWIEYQLPHNEYFKNFEDLKTNMEDLIVDRISKELESWENDQGKIKNVIESVEQSIQYQLNILEDELQAIEVDMQVDTTSITSDDSFSQKSSHGRRYSIPIDAGQMQISKISLPVKLINRICKPFGKTGNSFSGIFYDQRSEENLKEYRRDPINWLKMRLEKTLDTFVKGKQEGHLQAVISEIMREPKDTLRDIEMKMFAMVETNQNNMNQIHMYRKEGSFSREVYAQMLETLEHLKRTVAGQEL